MYQLSATAREIVAVMVSSPPMPAQEPGVLVVIIAGRPPMMEAPVTLMRRSVPRRGSETSLANTHSVLKDAPVALTLNATYRVR